MNDNGHVFFLCFFCFFFFEGGNIENILKLDGGDSFITLLIY